MSSDERPDDDLPTGPENEDTENADTENADTENADFDTVEMPFIVPGPADDELTFEIVELPAGSEEALQELLDARDFDRVHEMLDALGLFDDEARDIPPTLHSAYSGEPFAKCTSCDRVLEEDTIYQIEKVQQGTETIFEMAVCYECASDLGSEISEESQKVLQAFLRELLRGRYDESCCQSCGRPGEELPRKSVNAMCRGNKVIMPLVVVCEECEVGLQSRLSQQTRDSHDDFIRDNFPGVPAGLDLSPLSIF